MRDSGWSQWDVLDIEKSFIKPPNTKNAYVPPYIYIIIFLILIGIAIGIYFLIGNKDEEDL